MPTFYQPDTIKVFTFDELSNDAKEKARAWWRECEAQDPSGNEFVYDDATQCAAILGIEIAPRNQRWRNISNGREGVDTSPAIYYSGFWSQGDGACFEGSYSYAKGASKAIRAHAPTDTELHRIADELQALQRRNFYRLTARMKHRGHYYHSGCMSVDVDDNETRQKDWLAVEEALTQLMRDFADWIYKQLENEHDWQNADEQVDDNIRANEYTFDEEGNRAP